MINLNELKSDLILGSDDGKNGSDPSTRNIFTIRANGSDKTYLTDDSSGDINILASWSYNGSKIVYTHIDATNQIPYIWSMNADGSDKKQLTFGSLSGIAPTFSPDGKSILFTSYAESSDPVVGLELWVMSADGAGAHPITHTTVGGFSKDGTPLRWSMFGTYSPDGTEIAYASTQSGSSQIWVMNNDGSDKREITFLQDSNAPDANSPSWSPDGTEIAYAGGFAGMGSAANPFTINIYEVKPDGSGRTQLTFGSNNLTSDIPTWTPDSKYIYFGSIRNGPMETWVMRADGSDQQALFQSSNYYPSRRPVILKDQESGNSANTPPDSATTPSDFTNLTNDQSSDIGLSSSDLDLNAATEATDFSVGAIGDLGNIGNDDMMLASDLSMVRRSDDSGDIGGGSDGPM